MPYMTTHTLIHRHAHLQHRTMTGHNAKAVTARPRSAAQFMLHISLLGSLLLNLRTIIHFLSVLRLQTVLSDGLLGGKGVVLL